MPLSEALWQDSPQKLEQELARCRAALTDSQDRHRDTALLLERLSYQNKVLREELEHAQEKISTLEDPLGCEAIPLRVSAAGDQEKECMSLRLKARETMQALEARVQVACTEEQQWRQRCQELEAQAKQPLVLVPELHLANVELGNLRHRVWQLEQDLQAEKRLAAGLRAGFGRMRREVDEERQQASELMEMHAEQQQNLSEEHEQDTESLHFEVMRLQRELETKQRDMTAKADTHEVGPPSMPLRPPRSASACLNTSASSSTRARPLGVNPLSWSAGDSARQTQCRQCQYFYFPGDGEPETGRKCRQCQYYYFSPDGPMSPNTRTRASTGASNAGSYFGSSSPSRSPKRTRFPSAAPTVAEERAASTRFRVEMSALELALQEQEDAAFRSECEAERSSEAAAEYEMAAQQELRRCRALVQEEGCSAAAWRAEAEALTAKLAQESVGTTADTSALGSQASPGSPCSRDRLWEELASARTEIEQLEHQSHVWERRRNLWEERCIAQEAELEQARDLAVHDAQRAVATTYPTEWATSDDVSQRFVLGRQGGLASVQEDAHITLSEHQAFMASESDQCHRAKQELEDLRARHETWHVLLQAASDNSAGMRDGLDPPPTSFASSHDAVATGLRDGNEEPGCREGDDMEVADSIESHIRSLHGRLSPEPR